MALSCITGRTCPGRSTGFPEAEGVSQRPGAGGDTAVVSASRFVFSETAHAHAHALARLQGLFNKQYSHSRLLLYNDRCTAASRAPYRAREKAEGARLGSDKYGQRRNHRVWLHPKREFELYVPQYDLIPDAVGQRILEDAGE